MSMHEDSTNTNCSEVAMGVEAPSGWQVVSRLSHTFRTPLNHVLGFAEILDSQSFGPLNERQQKYVKKIQAAGRRQLKLLDQLVDIARVRTAELTVEDDEWELKATVEESVKARHPDAEARGVDLIVHMDSPRRVRGDFDRFCHIVDGLVAYGIKRSPPGHPVTVAVEATDARTSPTIFNISVSDAGQPLTPTEQMLFDGGAVYGGGQLGEVEGLGLLHARALTEKLGGSLSWTPGPEQGITTVLTVPFVQPAPGS
jgi:signal transduction histidine kinase